MSDEQNPATEQEARAEVNRRHPAWHDNGVGIVQGSQYRSGFVDGAEWQASRNGEPAEPSAIGKHNEPPVGSWVRDKHGATSCRQEDGWGQPGMMSFGRWEAMWDARGPYELCGPWGAAPSENTTEQGGTH